MDTARALDQIAEIHRQMAKGEVYRGYRSLPVASSGAIGLAAAWLQPEGLHRDPLGFMLYWTTIAVAAAFVGTCEIVYNYVVHEEASGRRQTRRVIGQFLPSLAAGVAITICLPSGHGGLTPLLPGLWAICFGTGVSACRPYLPRASGWIALFYLVSGSALLWKAPGPDALSGWAVGGTFGAGQLLSAAVLWWNLERSHDLP
ncbi:MAG TPA: hypothetical protein VGI12_08010 [Vicinamibacterales bacterium]|jgi:hypothetical protein